MAYKIQFITDTRFGGTKAKLRSMDSRLKRSIKTLNGVTLRTVEPLYQLDWDAEGYEGAKPSKQWRITYIVSKDTNKITWNTIMGKINKIYAPYYKRI